MRFPLHTRFIIAGCLWLPYQVSFSSWASSVFWKVHTLCLPRCQIVIIILSYHAWIYHANNDSTSIQLRTLFCTHQLGSFLDPCISNVSFLYEKAEQNLRLKSECPLYTNKWDITCLWLVTCSLLHFFIYTL